jgi:hypothetical protein
MICAVMKFALVVPLSVPLLSTALADVSRVQREFVHIDPMAEVSEARKSPGRKILGFAAYNPEEEKAKDAERRAFGIANRLNRKAKAFEAKVRINRIGSVPRTVEFGVPYVSFYNFRQELKFFEGGYEASLTPIRPNLSLSDLPSSVLFTEFVFQNDHRGQPRSRLYYELMYLQAEFGFPVSKSFVEDGYTIVHFGRGASRGSGSEFTYSTVMNALIRCNVTATGTSMTLKFAGEEPIELFFPYEPSESRRSSVASNSSDSVASAFRYEESQ